MRRLGLLLAVFGLVCAGVLALNHDLGIQAQQTKDNLKANIRVLFSPKGGCTEAIVSEIDSAAQTIRVQAYSFTSEPISQALIEASRRGVDVEIILDKGQKSEKYSTLTLVSTAGIPTLIDAKHAIAHNKIMLIDGNVIITGSFNFTNSAEERNAENLLIIKDQPELISQYQANYLKHREHSEIYPTGAAGPKQEAPEKPEPKPEIIRWQDAGKYIGQTRTVEGKIVLTYNAGDACFLNFSADNLGTQYQFP